MNKIAKIGLEKFSADFAVSDDFENPDGLLVRSASLHEMPVNENLMAIARAGAGTNNIPVDLMAEKGVVVFNTPGANANAVKIFFIFPLHILNFALPTFLLNTYFNILPIIVQRYNRPKLYKIYKMKSQKSGGVI